MQALDCYLRCGKQTDVSLSHWLALNANCFAFGERVGAAKGVELPGI